MFRFIGAGFSVTGEIDRYYVSGTGRRMVRVRQADGYPLIDFRLDTLTVEVA